MRRVVLIAVAAVLLVSFTALAHEKPPEIPVDVEENLRVFNALWKTVRDRFFDRKNYNGCDWDAMRDKYFPHAEAAATKAELYDTCNEMLEELDASHCQIISGYVARYIYGPESTGRNTYQAGLEIEKRKDRYFVRTLNEGGPAEKAGVLIGDEVVAIQGEKPAKSSILVIKENRRTADYALLTLKVEKGRPVTFGLRRDAGGDVTEVEVMPGLTSQMQGAADSVRVIKREGKKLGCVHLWHFYSSRMYKIFEEAINGKLKDCDGLLLDVRGRGGVSNMIGWVLRVFTSRQWDKPAVLLVDDRTASAKEVLAYKWKKAKIGPVVGVTTAGHVLACRSFRLPDGSVMLVPIKRVDFLSDGVVLEGVGVAPDVKVEKSFEYCRGKDPIFLKALEVLLKECSGAKGERDEYGKKVKELAQRYVELAEWCGENGLRREARTHFKAALEMDPDNRDAKKALAKSTR